MNTQAETQKSQKVAVIGGGLSGLTCACLLNRAGFQVTVCERSASLGGRAKTSNLSGFEFNYGPHALYRDGAAYRTLRSLDIPIKGQQPSTTKGYLSYQGQIYRLPANALQLSGSRFFSAADKLTVARWMIQLPKLDAHSLLSLTSKQWIQQHSASPRFQQWLAALIRLSTYCDDLDQLPATVACAQLQQAMQQGVVYLDHGWQSLVDNLSSQFSAGGGTIHKTAITTLTPTEHQWQLDCPTEKTQIFDAVILALPYKNTRELLAPLGIRMPAANPVYSTCLELGLSHLPRPKHGFVLGVDQPYYFSDHSIGAALAPKSQHAIHVAKYLNRFEDSSVSELKLELENWLDRIQPGWKQAVVTQRYLPKMMVTSHLNCGDASPISERLPGLSLAGDWACTDVILSDASLKSAVKAVQRTSDHLNSEATLASC